MTVGSVFSLGLSTRYANLIGGGFVRLPEKSLTPMLALSLFEKAELVIAEMHLCPFFKLLDAFSFE